MIAERAGQGGLTIERMCELAGVTRSAFYRHHEANAPAEADTALRDEMQRVALENRFYGYRRVTQELRRRGHPINAKRVRRLLQQDNLLAMRTRRFVPTTTDSRHTWRIWPNLARGLETSALDELWVADITYIRLREEFVYVAVVLDAHSRRVIGWALERHLGATVALQALRMALAARAPAPGLIHHSDRGVQYACSDYLTLLAEHQIQPSMSRPGNPYDNARAESFMKTLKQEQISGQKWRDLEELRAGLQQFFEEIYNRKRLHSAIRSEKPAGFEAKLRPTVSTQLSGARVEPLAPHPTPRQHQSPIPLVQAKP
jgi:transposase InsO family protein